jgi:hypothetical protein
MDDETKQIVTASLTALVRHAMTVAGGALATAGYLAPSQQVNFTEIGVGLVLGVAGYGWSVLNKRAVVKAK